MVDKFFWAVTARQNMSVWGLFLAVLAVFLVIYNLSFQSAVSLTSARLVVMFLLLYYFLVPKNFQELGKGVDFRIFIIFLPVPYILAQYVFVGDFGQLSRFFYLFLYSFLGAILLAKMIGGLDRWLLVFLLAVWLQSIVVLFSFVSIDYRAWVATNLATGGNFDAGYLYRAPGLSGASGSDLSVIQSLGVLAGGLYLSVKKDLRNPGRACVYLMMLICMISCVVVGRTGLIMSVSLLVLFVLTGVVDKSLVAMTIFVVTISAAALVEVVGDMLPSDFSLEYFSGWLLGFIYGEDQTLDVLGAMPIAPLSIETFFGAGLVSLIGGANPSGHDSGFIQGYYSMGLPIAALFYVFYAYVLFRLLRWLGWGWRIIIAGIFFIIEVKEPFVFKYAVMFFLVGAYFSWSQFEVQGES